MTREEAINWLDRLYMGANITDEYGDMVDMQPYEEAFNMAIKALEQEPCEDAISESMDEIRALSPVTPKARWIPCNERLPETTGRYLTYIVNKHDNRLRYIMTCDYLADNYWHWYPDDEDASDNVVAWMPLPQPYAESEDRRSKDYRRATNGDMIKAMFPNAQIDYHEKSDLVDDYVTVFIKGCDTCQDYSYAWWNEPYKAESEE